jgi:hypothetical protein
MSHITSQQARRRDPYPWTWELPAGITMAFVVLAALAAHLGRAVANRVAGASWLFPARADLFTCLPALVTGHADAGLPRGSGPLASSTAVLAWVAVTELLLLVAVLAGLKLGLDRWGPGRMRGMASRHESEQLLGRSRLRRNATVIRPDLYGKRSRQ